MIVWKAIFLWFLLFLCFDNFAIGIINLCEGKYWLGVWCLVSSVILAPIVYKFWF